MKRRLRPLLLRRDLDEIARLASQRHRVLDLLVSLTYDPDVLVGWRAVEAMGAAGQRIAQHDPDRVHDHLRRLHWLMNEESGGICWRAPEAMAEIVWRCATVFDQYIPIIVSLIHEMADEDLEHFRPGVLWAIGRLASVSHKRFDGVVSAVVACLDRSTPQVRGMAVWCLAQYGRQQFFRNRADLLADRAPVALYEDGQLTHTSIGELGRRFRHAMTEKTGLQSRSCSGQ